MPKPAEANATATSEKAAVLAEVAKLTAKEPEREPEVKAEEAKTEEPVVEEKTETKAETTEEPVETKAEEPEDKQARSKWLEQKHREEKKLAQERQKLQAEWSPKIEKVERFENEIEPALKSDPIGALIRAGYLDPGNKDQIHRAGQKLRAYYLKLDPKSAQAGDVDLRSVEHEDEVRAARREAAEAKAEIARYQTEQKVQRYLDSAFALATDTTPAIKSLIANDPTEARQVLDMVGAHLMQETGEWPTPQELIEAAEKVERHNLKKRGIDPETYYAPKAPPKTPTQPADEKKTAKSLPAALGTPTTPKGAPMTPAEEKEFVLRQIRASAGE